MPRLSAAILKGQWRYLQVMMRGLSLLTFTLMLSSSALASLTGAKTIDEVEAAVAQLQGVVGTALTDAARMEASEQIHALLTTSFELPEAFTHPFASWDKVASTVASDAAFRLFNWNIPMLDGTHQYRAVILFPDKKYRSLTSKGSLQKADENKVLSAKDWYGALYYHIEPVKHKGDTYYTLIGWDGHNMLSNKKVLDVLWFNKKREPFFGKAVFVDGDSVGMRRVFEFAKSAHMTLSYLPAKEAIVYNVLIPSTGAAEGNYSYYVAGTEYHGYELKDGEWIHSEDIDMKRPKSEENKPQFNFPARPDLNRKRDTINPMTGKE